MLYQRSYMVYNDYFLFLIFKLGLNIEKRKDITFINIGFLDRR
jgi:hypothetical protein